MRPFFYIASVSISITLAFAAGLFLSGPPKKGVTECLNESKIKNYEELVTKTQKETFKQCLADLK